MGYEFINSKCDESDAQVAQDDAVTRLARRLDTQREKATAASAKVAEILVKASNLHEADLERFCDLVADCRTAKAVWQLRTLGPRFLAEQAADDVSDRAANGYVSPIEALSAE
jgi:hypothetical protein